ncbi:hypothetical protein F6X42_36070 [Paraburkholderia sp. WC7.3b]|uniref:Uncharacterized protein n=1 Tax=Paraburkholderia podalyriae TaxID=1938811 RepID=A0ABR7PZN5_9BURK|nr:hypothetical protein [Paraburkholderia podalyriae]
MAHRTQKRRRLLHGALRKTTARFLTIRTNTPSCAINEGTNGGPLLTTETSNAESAYRPCPGHLAPECPALPGIALRGMSEKNILVLMDGERSAPDAFASGGSIS